MQKEPLKPLGQILVESGVIQNSQLDEALKYQRLKWEQLDKDNSLLEQAVKSGLVRAEEIEELDPLQDKALLRVVEAARKEIDSSVQSLDEYLANLLGKDNRDYLFDRCNLALANDLS